MVRCLSGNLEVINVILVSSWLAYVIPALSRVGVSGLSPALAM